MSSLLKDLARIYKFINMSLLPFKYPRPGVQLIVILKQKLVKQATTVVCPEALKKLADMSDEVKLKEEELISDTQFRLITQCPRSKLQTLEPNN